MQEIYAGYMLCEIFTAIGACVWAHSVKLSFFVSWTQKSILFKILPFWDTIYDWMNQTNRTISPSLPAKKCPNSIQIDYLPSRWIDFSLLVLVCL